MKVCPKSGSLYKQTSEQIFYIHAVHSKDRRYHQTVSGSLVQIHTASIYLRSARNLILNGHLHLPKLPFPWSTFSCPMSSAALVDRQYCKQTVRLTQSNSPRTLANLGDIAQLASK